MPNILETHTAIRGLAFPYNAWYTWNSINRVVIMDGWPYRISGKVRVGLEDAW